MAGEGRTEVVIHWRGGRTDAVSVKRRKRKPVCQRDGIDTVELVRRLAGFHPDTQFATILNHQGRRSARGLPYSRSLAQNLRYRNGVPRYGTLAEDEEDEGELPSVRAAAQEPRAPDTTLCRWINDAILSSCPDVPGAPIRIRMGAGFHHRLRLEPPDGLVPLREAMRRLGVSGQAVWQRAASGQLESRHVKRGPSTASTFGGKRMSLRSSRKRVRTCRTAAMRDDSGPPSFRKDRRWPHRAPSGSDLRDVSGPAPKSLKTLPSRRLP